MPATDRLPRADILVLCWRHEIPGNEAGEAPSDPVWSALRRRFGIEANTDPRSYERGADQLLPDLWSYKLVQEQRDRIWLLHPEVSGRLGRYHAVQVEDRSVCLFRSELRLNTDGPAMPVFRLVRQLIEEARPALVLTVGLGGGVQPEDQGGDVVLATRARFQMAGELETSPLNGEAFGGLWQPRAEWLDGLAFAPLREPRLVPPSPNYQVPAPLPQPAVHTPRTRLADKPVATCPLVSRHGFRVGTPQGAEWLGDTASATDMDAAVVAHTCGRQLRAGCIVGLAVPALRILTNDFERSLRNAWIDLLTVRFGNAAADNAAQVVHRLCTRADLDA